jgi:hypothetical protein
LAIVVSSTSMKVASATSTAISHGLAPTPLAAAGATGRVTPALIAKPSASHKATVWHQCALGRDHGHSRTEGDVTRRIVNDDLDRHTLDDLDADNQHVAGGDVIVRIDDRDYRVALDQAKPQLAHDQAVLEQAQTNLARYQFLAERNAIAKEQRDDQAFLVDQDKATVALDQAKVDEA